MEIVLTLHLTFVILLCIAPKKKFEAVVDGIAVDFECAFGVGKRRSVKYQRGYLSRQSYTRIIFGHAKKHHVFALLTMVAIGLAFELTSK